MVVQHHPARRAGDHHDLRLGDPVTGQAHSWATKKDIPGPGDPPIAVYQQPTHTYDYLNFEGELTKGYGRTKKGKKVRAIFDEPVEILQADKNFFRFNTYTGGEPQEFVLLKKSGKPKERGNPWLLVNVTKTRERMKDLPLGKPKYKEIAPGAIDMSDADQVMSAKLDGGHVLFPLESGKRPRVFSYREPKRGRSGLIDHSAKLESLYHTRVPKAVSGKGTILRGEVYAQRPGGGPVAAETVGGMLNASAWKSRQLQKKHGKLRPAIFDVVKYRGQDMTDATYTEKLRVLREVQANMPQFEIPDIALSEKEKRRLYEAIRQKTHPATHEGMILWNAHTKGRPTKAKFTVDHDVYIRGITQARDKSGRPKQEAGAFLYSRTPDGPVVGKVGTGFSRKLRRDMWSRKESYIGGVAKVTAEKATKRGALTKPRFSGWHSDKSPETFWAQNPVLS